jgi:hypothetical protein
MCVDPARGALPTRSTFLNSIVAGSAFATAAFAAVGSVVRADAVEPVALPDPPTGMTPANARAAAIAASSPFVTGTYARIHDLASSIGDPELRANVAALLADPKPTFAARYPTDQSRRALRDSCVSAGYVAANAPLATLFPPNTDGNRAPQPFWGAAGSYNGCTMRIPVGSRCTKASMRRWRPNSRARTIRRTSAARKRSIAISQSVRHSITT